MRPSRRIIAGLALVGALWMGGAPMAAGPTPTPAGFPIVSSPPFIDTRQRAVLQADIVNATTTLVDVPALSCGVGANQTYTFTFLLVLRSATTSNGIKLAFAGPASPLVVSYFGPFPFTPGGNSDVFWSQFFDPVVGGGVIVANTDLIAKIQGTVKAGATGGNVFPQIAASAALGQNVTLRNGSSMECSLL